MLIAVAFLRLAHFYGASSGVVGVVMYETDGLVAPWIIHFMQDVVIFATLFLLTAFI